MPLNETGTFYPSFTNNPRYTDADKVCVREIVTKLLTETTSEAKPAMLLGKIQSGKTKTFLAAIALAFDNSFDVAIILTKGTKALTKQTIARVRKEFAAYASQDQLKIFDIMTVPSGLTPYELNQKMIFVSKKQADNMDRLVEHFHETYPQLAQKRVLIIDDEADYASIGFRNTKEEGTVPNRTTRQIDRLRTVIPNSAFMQVTATPYSLYLQPEDLQINGNEFKPIRPAFTSLVPISPAYVGGDFYFDQSQEDKSVASFLYQPVDLTELGILRRQDRRRFRIEECLTSPAISVLRSAICNFIVGGIIRRLQDEKAGLPPKKFSFLVHVEAQKAAHAWQESIVMNMNEKLLDAARNTPDVLRDILTSSYNDLSNSIQAMGHYLPPLDDVLRDSLKALVDGWLMIAKVNSERQVEELLDDEGQLHLRTPLNIFIGGQILDRGVTIANLIGFFYGRRPMIFQQDTVLQHSRMFGFRPKEDLAVTRFYTEPQIYDAMRRMHESDVALRETIERNPDNAVVFIRRDDRGQVIPCSPNKILVSNTTTLRPFKRILPIGFQSDYATRAKAIVEGIDKALDGLCPADGFKEPILMELSAALGILKDIEKTLIMEEVEGYKFDWEAAKAALSFMSNDTEDLSHRGKVWCLVRKDRSTSRRINLGGRPAYSDAPDTTHVEGVIAKRVAVDIPMLMLFRQNGAESSGWRDTPFYWPVIWAPQRTRTTIFAHETTL